MFHDEGYSDDEVHLDSLIERRWHSRQYYSWRLTGKSCMRVNSPAKSDCRQLPSPAFRWQVAHRRQPEEKLFRCV